MAHRTSSSASSLSMAREALDAGDFARACELAEDAVREADAPRRARPRGRAGAHPGDARPSSRSLDGAATDGAARAEARRVLALALLQRDRPADATR
jgi:hypothetical protein